MFSIARSFLFRVVERDPPFPAASSSSAAFSRFGGHGRGKHLRSAVRSSSSSNFAPSGFHPKYSSSPSPPSPTDQQHQHQARPVGQAHRLKRGAGAATLSSSSASATTAAARESEYAQRRFESSKWRGVINGEDFDQQQQQRSNAGRGMSTAESKLKTANTFARLSRDDAVAAHADRLRRGHVETSGVAAPRAFERLSPYADDAHQRGSKRSSADVATKMDRREALQQMRQDLISSDKWLSTVEITEGDAESADEIDELNRQSGKHMVVSSRSALGRNLLLRNTRASLRNHSTWEAIDTSEQHVEQLLDDVAARSSDAEWDRSEGHYRHTFDASTNLEHQRDAVQHSTSIYSNRALQIPGLYCYHSFITPLEEKQIVAELMRLLLKPVAAFFADEGRYCVSLFEKRLGSAQFAAEAASKIGGGSSDSMSSKHQRKDEGNETSGSSSASPPPPPPCLTFSIADDAPTLHSVLQRAARTELIPSMPNVVQVSEFVSAFAGYKPQLKHSSIGSYCGLLNLVSNAQMDLVHVDQPWAPKVMLVPRGLYVCGEQLMREFRIGYQHLDWQYTTHQGRARFTKDYRIEVMFATVDAESVPRLQVPLKMTEYAESKDKAHLTTRDE